jgi:molybdopterin synthase catalytic subunit
VHVRLFASYREAAGVGHIELDLHHGATAKDVIAEIARRHPLISEGRSVVIAKNREYVTPDEPLADGDEVALIPPVSGGAEMTIPLVRIMSTPLSVDDAIAAASERTWGGIVVFLGTVRESSRGKRVTHLEYEAYAEMAEDVMAKLAADLESRYELCAVSIHHRIGRVEIGEASVVIAVSAPHRQDALAACKDAIDTLKETVPLWKKEVYEGGEEWIGRGS